MSILSPLLLLLPRIAVRRAVSKHLATSIPADECDWVWQRTVRLQSELCLTRPRHSFGVNLFLRYMEWDNALYRALREHGIPQEQASQLIEEINWEVFGAGNMVSFTLSRLRSSKLQTRIQWILDLMFFALFTKPFRKEAVPSESGIAFDVVCCPVADYFRQQGIPELTRYAACNLDHRMAQNWGVKLTRTQTIAKGDAHCDFRYRIAPTEDVSFK